MNRLEFLQNRKVLGSIVVVLVLAVVGVMFLMGKKGATPAQPAFEQTAQLSTLTPQELGMVVTVRSDKNALKFEIKNYKDIEKIEYTITYNKDVDGETVSEGLFGEMNIAKDGITVTDYRPFGTCSSGVCRYDKVVSDPVIALKVTKKDGKEYQAVKTVSLE